MDIKINARQFFAFLISHLHIACVVSLEKWTYDVCSQHNIIMVIHNIIQYNRLNIYEAKNNLLSLLTIVILSTNYYINNY